MGSNLRLYLMPDGMLIGFYREQGGYVMYAKVPLSDKVIFAYMNPEDDDRFELLGATREPKSEFGSADSVSIKDTRTGAVNVSRAKFLGYAFECGENRYQLARAIELLPF